MDHIPRLSEVLYVGLCRKLGTPTEVTIRRDVMDMTELIRRPFCTRRGIVQMDSGSYKEGFRSRTSDKDFMFWCCNQLITDTSQSRDYNTSKNDIILMEDSDTPPGFVRLRLLTSPPRNIFTLSCLVDRKDGAYLSSFLWRNTYFQLVMNHKSSKFMNYNIHGPCTSGFFGYDKYGVEVDHAFCIATLCLPKILRHWVDRCQILKWPPVPVLENILRKGCHCIPIGSKIDSTFNELEWRLSFSYAEQQLVSTMNHTQFLCYGLLKIFLKEVINYNREPLLCSYYMKTTVFWIMQYGHVRWCPNRLLDCFWICFKYLIHCVNQGVFPNFFISLNNMFINKVVGDARESLLQQLYQYYRMGVSCLLLSPSLRSILEPALSSPTFMISSAEGEFMATADKDLCGSYEVFQTMFFSEQVLDCYLYLTSIDKLSRLSKSPYQLLTLQYCTAESLVCIALTMARSSSYYTNKNVYITDRMICNMLKLAAKIGPVSSLIYLAMHYYRTGRYVKSLHITCLAKLRLYQTFNIYNTKVLKQSYNETVNNISLSRRMNLSWANHVPLFITFPCIEELDLELNVIEQTGNTLVHLSPFIMTEMLSVISHFRLGNISQCLQSLIELQELLLCPNRKYIPVYQRDLSWQILGICQLIVGDLHGALLSFEVSLKQVPFHRIQEATDARIGYIKQQLHRNM